MVINFFIIHFRLFFYNNCFLKYFLFKNILILKKKLTNYCEFNIIVI